MSTATVEQETRPTPMPAEAVEAGLASEQAPRPSVTAGRRRTRWRRIWLLVTLAAVVLSLAATGLGDRALVRSDGLSSFTGFFGAALSPRLDGEFLAMTVNATLTTLAYAVLGTALSLVIGVVGGVLSSETWWTAGARSRGRRGRAGWAATRAAFVIPRGIHEVVWGLFFLLVFGLDPMVAVLAIGIPFGAVTAKVFSELLDETSRRPYEALLAAGAGRRSAILYGLVPPALSDLLSYGFYRFECAIRTGVILGLIGAGGLGFELALSFQALLFGEIWTLLFALILLSVAADGWSSIVRARRSNPRPRPGGRHDPVLVGSLIVGALLVPVAAWWIGLDLRTLGSDRAWGRTADLFAEAWPPTLGNGGLGELVELSGITLAMSVLAMVVAFWGGAALAFPAARLPRLGRRAQGAPARRAGRMALFLLSRTALVVLRAIPPPVWALLFLFLFFPGIVPGALALGVYTAGVLGRLMAEAAENLDGRPLRALRAHGVPEPLVFSYAIVPAAAARFVAYGLYRWEVTIRETVVVGVVGAGGLGLVLQQQVNAFSFAAALTTLITLVLLTLVVDVVSAAVRRSLR